MKHFHKNPRQITKKQFADLQDSLKRLGDLSGIVHDLASDEVIGGNQRMDVFDLKTAQIEIAERFDQPDEQGTVARGFVIWQGKKYSYRAVMWDDKTREEANIRANKAGGSWDFDMLANGFELPDLLEWGFTEEELTGLDFGEEEPGEDPGAQIDKAEELREKWQVEPGQLWQLGDHRLICGDCTDRETYTRLLCGDRPDVLHADPPYGISLLKKDGSLGKSQKYRPVEGDNKAFDPQYLLEYAPTVILWGANHYADKLPPSPFWLVWDKQGGAKDTTFATCELAWCSDKQPARVLTHVWDGFRRDSEKGEERYHPTQKPVAVIEWALGWVEGSIVVDLYSGTGPTILACEHMNKKCRAIEQDPGYCAVTLERWHVMTGKTPVLIG